MAGLATPCTTPGCPHLSPGGRCPDCRRRRAAAGDRARGTARKRYPTQWDERRADYLRRYRWCKLCGTRATVADHYPRTRKQLLAAGVADPDADEHLRPLCTPCHNRETARHTPGGWARDRDR